MYQNKLLDSISSQQLINQHEGILECHFKIKAMLDVLLSAGGLDNYSHTTLYQYLWTIGDIADRGIALGEGIVTKQLFE
jgi:hypothetical protein